MPVQIHAVSLPAVRKQECLRLTKRIPFANAKASANAVTQHAVRNARARIVFAERTATRVVNVRENASAVPNPAARNARAPIVYVEITATRAVNARENARAVPKCAARIALATIAVAGTQLNPSHKMPIRRITC